MNPIQTIISADDQKYTVQETIPEQVKVRERDIYERKDRLAQIAVDIEAHTAAITTLTDEKTQIENELASVATVAAKAVPVKPK